MARSTKTQQALNLNAAHGLLSRGSSVAEAAALLAQERGISLRQAYRYLQDARALGRAMPVGEPSVPATFKIPRDVLAQLRAIRDGAAMTPAVDSDQGRNGCINEFNRKVAIPTDNS
jgi:hypothetical protein